MEAQVNSIEKVSKGQDTPARARAAHQSPTLRNSFGVPNVQQTAGNLAMQRMYQSGMIQAKLAVSQPGDPAEEEADRVADHVMRMSELTVQRKCDACAAGGPCPKCDEEKIQRKATANHSPEASPGVSSQITSLRGKGQPLPASTRAFFEPRFRQDLGQVRVHTDSQAAESARAIQARAYTVGQNVVFGAGQFLPENGEGRWLMAHELAHVVQQGEGVTARGLKVARAVDPSKGEPIRKELDSLVPFNSTIEGLWASLGADLPEAINDGRVVTVTPNKKTNKLESYRDLWWRSVLDEGISVSNAGTPILAAFAADTLALATNYVSSQHMRFDSLHKELKRAKEQKVEPAPPNSSTLGGVEDPKKGMSRMTTLDPILDARRLVDSATLVHFLLNWEDILKTSPIGMRRIDTSGLLPTPGPAAGGGAFDPFPNRPQSQMNSSSGSPQGQGPAAATQPVLFDPTLTLDKILGLPNIEVFDAEAFDTLQKTYRECSEKKVEFKEVVQKLLQEDANLAVLAEDKNKNLLKQVSALSGQSDQVAADVIDRVAKQNADDAKRFLDMLAARSVDWVALRPIHTRLFAGDGVGRDWTNITARGFVEAYFKKREEAERDRAQAELIKNLALGAATFVALLTPAAPLAAVFLLTVDALTVAGSVADSNAATKKADTLSAGAAAGVVDKDDARRAKEDADSKRQTMVIDILVTALPYLGHLAKGGVKLAEILGRETRWAMAARGAAETKSAAALGGALKAELTAAETTTKEIKGIPDGIQRDKLHELKYGPHGPERCSDHCLIFGQSLSERGKFVQGHVGSTERVKQRAMYLQARGDSISVRAKEIAKLPAGARSARESALLREAYEVEMHMVEIEQEAVGIISNRLPASYKGRWSNALEPGTGRWYPTKDHPAYKYCGDRGIPYHNGYPNYTELALPGGEVNLLPGKKVVVDGVQKDAAMVGKMSDFEVADALAAQMTNMKDANAFRDWRLDRGFTWHHRENGVTMQLVPTELHASIPHIGGASLQRGVPVP